MAINITFTSGIYPITISGTVVYGTEFWDDRYGQKTLRTGDGALVTYDNAGINIVNGKIVIKNVSYADGEILREWIQKRIKFRLNNFIITVPADVDLGQGKGVNLVNVIFDEDTTKGLLKYKAPGNYDVNFPYTYVRILGFINGLLNVGMTLSATIQATRSASSLCNISITCSGTLYAKELFGNIPISITCSGTITDGT